MRTRIDRRFSNCKACGVHLSPFVEDCHSFEVQDAMVAYCVTCAKELLGLPFEIGRPHTFNNDTGGGQRVVKETKTH